MSSGPRQAPARIRPIILLPLRGSAEVARALGLSLQEMSPDAWAETFPATTLASVRKQIEDTFSEGNRPPSPTPTQAPGWHHGHSQLLRTSSVVQGDLRSARLSVGVWRDVNPRDMMTFVPDWGLAVQCEGSTFRDVVGRLIAAAGFLCQRQSFGYWEAEGARSGIVAPNDLLASLQLPTGADLFERLQRKQQIERLKGILIDPKAVSIHMPPNREATLFEHEVRFDFIPMPDTLRLIEEMKNVSRLFGLPGMSAILSDPPGAHDVFSLLRRADAPLALPDAELAAELGLRVEVQVRDGRRTDVRVELSTGKSAAGA